MPKQRKRQIRFGRYILSFPLSLFRNKCPLSVVCWSGRIYIPTTVNWSKKELVLDVRKWWRWNCAQQRNVLQNQWKWNTEGTSQSMMRAVKLYSRNKSILGADESNPAPSIGILWDCWTLPNSALPLVPNPSNIPLKSNTSHRKASNILHCHVSLDRASELFQEPPSLFNRVQLNKQSWLSQRQYKKHLWHPLSLSRM